MSADEDVLARRFEAHRTRLRALAWRMLGSRADADDAVQEAWLRLQRSDAGQIDRFGAWLTTVVSRICLDVLAARRRNPSGSLDDATLEIPSNDALVDPERTAVLADSIGAALQIVLDTLTPAERLAFVLHDLFAVPFDQVASILDATPANARQLASRARRRVQGAPEPPRDPTLHAEVVSAFLAASREGDFAGLLAVLAPDAHLRADTAAAAMGAGEARGADAIAAAFAGRARAARLALIDGRPGLAWSVRGVPQVLFEFDIDGRLVTALHQNADPDRLAAADIVHL